MPFRFQFVSDLHIEFLKNIDALKIQVLTDLLIIAGNIGSFCHPNYNIFLSKVCKDFKRVLLVPGNREFYQTEEPFHTAQQTKTFLSNLQTSFPNLTVLQKGKVTIGDIKFLGTTLWTFVPEEYEALVQSGMSDYKKIYLQSSGATCKNITVDDTKSWHKEELEWLQKELEEIVPTIVITHHNPTEEHLDKKFVNSFLSYGYYTDLTFMQKEPILCWISGHSNVAKSFRVGGVLNVINSRGYSFEDVQDYDPSRIIEVFECKAVEFVTHPVLPNPAEQHVVSLRFDTAV